MDAAQSNSRRKILLWRAYGLWKTGKIEALAQGGGVVCQDTYSEAGNIVCLPVPNQCHTQERQMHLTEQLNFAFFSGLSKWFPDNRNFFSCLENGNSWSYPLLAILVLACFPQEINLKVKCAVCRCVHEREKAREKQSVHFLLLEFRQVCHSGRILRCSTFLNFHWWKQSVKKDHTLFPTEKPVIISHHHFHLLQTSKISHSISL